MDKRRPIVLATSRYHIEWNGEIIALVGAAPGNRIVVWSIVPDEVIYGGPSIGAYQLCRSVLVRKGNDYTVWQNFGHTFTTSSVIKEYVHNNHMMEPAVVLTDGSVIFPVSRVIASPSNSLRLWLADKKYDYMQRHSIIIPQWRPSDRKTGIIDNICAYKEWGAYAGMVFNANLQVAWAAMGDPTVEVVINGNCEEFDLTLLGLASIFESYMERMRWELLPESLRLG